MNVLLVKLSSLGDVVHAMPAVQDIRERVPDAQVDWVVEKGFAPLVARCDGVSRVIACELRRWRKSPLARSTRDEWRAFRSELRSREYDGVVDLQGLTKSALVARTARMATGGRRIAMGNRTEGSSYEAPTRWVADVAVPLEPHVHAVTRSRLLCAQAFGYELPAHLRFGLRASPSPATRTVCFVHGTSRDDKCWPEAHWVALGRRFVDAGWRIALPQGSEAERERSERIATEIGPAAEAWPSLDLGALVDRMAACGGVVGVDSGLSHIAVALDLPHVQVYNFDTAWRTGPLDTRRQRAVFASPTPSVDAVWDAWQSVGGLA